MQITLNIPDELVLTVLRILEEKDFPDDDGMTDAVIMKDLDISVEHFIMADHYVDEISNAIKRNLKS